MPIKKCECCNTEFMARLTRIRTCSLVCRNRLISQEKAQRHIKSKQCVVCGTGFEVGGSEWNRTTCSKSCQYQLTASKTTRSLSRTCLTCGSEFIAKASQVNAFENGGAYCSKKCMHERNKSATTRPCGYCGTLFSRPPSQSHIKTCSSECGYKLYSGPVRYGYRGSTELVVVDGVKRSRRTRLAAVEHMLRRRVAEERATPSWANQDEIRKICEETAALQAATGVKYHVDHIVPLRGKTVCGLHCEANLQALPALENISKGHRKWPDMW